MSDECASARRVSSLLNKNVITVTYNDVSSISPPPPPQDEQIETECNAMEFDGLMQMPDFVRNATVKAANMVRHLLGSHMTDNQVDVNNDANQIRIESVYYPLIGSLDVHVHKPKSNTFYDGIAIHPLAEIVLPERMSKPRSVLGGRGYIISSSCSFMDSWRFLEILGGFLGDFWGIFGGFLGVLFWS